LRDIGSAISKFLKRSAEFISARSNQIDGADDLFEPALARRR
jgi:hypothetical protein